MSLRTTIQNKVVSLVESGTFPAVTYVGNTATDTGVLEAPKSIICNEISGGLTDKAKTGATAFKYSLTGWRFECVVDFSKEVDTSTFLLGELKNLNFNVDDMLVSITPTGDFNVTHPPRQGSHNGTKLTIGLTVNTRR